MGVTRVRISIRDGGLCATASVSPGERATADDARAAVVAAGVTHGVDGAAVARLATMLADPTAHGDVAVATGTAPQHGADGRVEVNCASHFAIGTHHPDGHIDYFERDFLQPIAAEQEIATIVAPEPGIAGRDVRGQPIAAKPGKPHRMRFGPGVRLKADTVTAAIGGVLVQDPGSLDVTPLFVHGGDVDLDHGNLRSEGSLQVRGSVQDGFTVSASGDVEISGSVFAASVTAGGALRIGEGALGGARVQSGSHLTCHHATSAQLQAVGVVDVGDQATWCKITAERIQVARGRGSAFGGVLRARQEIVVGQAGTAQGSRTLLSVGDLGDEVVEQARRSSEADKLGRVAQRAGREPGRLGRGKATRMALRADDDARGGELRQRMAQRELLRTATIEVLHTIQPGVTLQFGSHRLEFPEPRPGGRFRFDSQSDTIVEERRT